VPYELHTAQFDWTATLDKLTWSGAYLDGPVQAKATFTKIADLGLTAPTGPTTVTAGYVAGVDGLDVDLDLNQGTSSSDGEVDSYDVEWGDTNTATSRAARGALRTAKSPSPAIPTPRRARPAPITS
jgi:hypothetical protein